MQGTIGYCTNVHAGGSLVQTRAQLARHAVKVKEAVHPWGEMRLGLWFSGNAADELLQDGNLEAFASWLGQRGLVPFTLNGFPYCDFHQPVVKHLVYQPDWRDPRRRDYTAALAQILARLLPDGEPGTISTLPLCWGGSPLQPADWELAARHLAEVAEQLARIERQTGHGISVALEPEPGCALQRSGDVVQFFERFLLPGRDEGLIRRHVRVCHDICHAAVMHEPQEACLRTYHAAGIRLGKLQISSAVRARLLDATCRVSTLEAMEKLAEPRYLHQTTVACGELATRFFDDLPEALAFARAQRDARELRVHFHVPVYLRQFGPLEAMQDEIRECLRVLARYSNCRHFEVETYAWGVLPRELRQPTLAEGIARELVWFGDILAEVDAGD